MARRTRLIIVCDRCLRAVCWYGEMMCDEAFEAGTVQKTARELRKLDLEHPDYFSKAYVEKVCGGSDYAPTPPGILTPAGLGALETKTRTQETGEP